MSTKEKNNKNKKRWKDMQEREIKSEEKINAKKNRQKNKTKKKTK